MLITATQKNTRQTPRKVRLVANTVKKMPLEKALQQLAVMERRASLVIMKVMKQALANAINNHGLKFNDLVLDNILVTEGPRYRRFRAVSRGRAHGVIKRTSHITVTLLTKDEASKKTTKPEVKETATTSVSLPETAAPEVKAEPKTKKAAPKKAASPAKKSPVKKAAAPKKEKVTK